MISRRDFLKLSGAGILSLYVATRAKFVRRAHAYQSSGLLKYTQPLRGVFPLDPNGIPVAIPDGKRRWNRRTTAQHYTIDINQYTDQLHPQLGPTTLRGYHSRANLGGSPPQRHLGGIIVAQKGEPVQITFQNNLSGDHPLPVDPTVMGTEMGVNRVSTHLHGGFLPWISDGGPYAWFDGSGNYGESVPMSFYRALNPNLMPGQAEYYYPNDQSARMMWYHDHAVGITRLNAYAGIATGYIIRDTFEGSLRNKGLPDFIENGGRELPIVIQDKVFVGDDISITDPGWLDLPVPGTNGSLWYPHVYDAEIGPGEPIPDSNLSILPEMFGDTMLANGVAYPEVTLEARRYRLRVLNACQARFLNLQLYVDDGSSNSITFDSSFRPLNARGPDFLVLGTEGGFLAKPVLVPSNLPFDAATRGGSLITAPAERWDIIVDFRGYENKKIVLYNDAPAPFPAEVADPFMDIIGESESGPNTRQIMRFNIIPASGPADPPLKIDTSTRLALNPLSGIDWPLTGLWTTQPLPPPPGVKVRNLTLNESFDGFGRLMQLLGTNIPMAAGSEEYGRAYMDMATETPRAGSVEVWRIANLSADTHPIHFHLANVQILSRRPFSFYANGTPTFSGPARGPAPLELGWKETVKMHPGEVTTVIMRFNLPDVPFRIPASPRTGGHEYVWHCHILEHEEHDMMRPLVVT
jgi:spore coat protein A